MHGETMKKVPGVFPGRKGGPYIGLKTLPLHVPIFLKSESPNLLKTSGPLQACNGIALPLFIYRKNIN